MIKKISLKLLGLILILILIFLLISIDTMAIERRRDQFPTESGYYISPIPYSLPGIGDGILLGGAYNNIADTHSDVIGFVLTGDIEGWGLVSLDNHIYSNLILDVSAQYLSKMATRSYNGRGMSTKEDDYIILGFKDSDYTSMRLTGTWFDRMFEVYAAVLKGQSHLSDIRDKEGNLILNTSGGTKDSSTLFTAGLRLDWTDDYQDPRQGIRYQLSRWWTKQASQLDAEQYQIEHNLTGFLPVGRRSTLVLNYFRADAHVTRMGETDFTAIEVQQGVNCSDSSLTSVQQIQCTQVVNNTIANNIYGSVSSLGGWGRLRSYPDGRFSGAHAEFYGAEFRWNITDEFTPFDIWIAKDIRTTIQLAFFYERGSIEDNKYLVGNTWRNSYGRLTSGGIWLVHTI